jgi:hypothetical protein
MTVLPLRFQPRPWDERVRTVLETWRGTRYQAGQQARGRAVDCVRFIAGVLDDLYGFVRERLERLPPDTSLHDPEGARAALRTFLRIYSPNVQVEGDSVESGDVVIVGPAEGGPGHALIVGGRRGELWHASSRGVVQGGYSIDDGQMHVGTFRVTDKELWL